jgi:hypothetical protein
MYTVSVKSLPFSDKIAFKLCLKWELGPHLSMRLKNLPTSFNIEFSY